MLPGDTATHHRHYSGPRHLAVPPARLAALAPLAVAWGLPSVRALLIRYAARRARGAARPRWERLG